MNKPETTVQNGHGKPPRQAKRTCLCGCGGPVPDSSRFSYLKGHMKRLVARSGPSSKRPCANGCGRTVHGNSKDTHCRVCRGAPKPAPKPDALARVHRQPSINVVATPVSGPVRVALHVTETQLDQFLTGLPLKSKQTLANYHLQNEVQPS